LSIVEMLYWKSKGISNAIILKDPGTKVEKTFIEGAVTGSRRQRKARNKVE